MRETRCRESTYMTTLSYRSLAGKIDALDKQTRILDLELLHGFLDRIINRIQ